MCVVMNELDALYIFNFTWMYIYYEMKKKRMYIMR